MEHLPEGTDPRSGYCSSDGIYYSKRPPVWIPPTRNFDLVSFVFAPQFGDRVAMVDAPTGRSLTYAQLERNVRVVAAGLYKNLGVRQYDVVMLLSPNSIEFAVVFFAVMSLGAVLTTVNSVNTTGEIQKQMNDAGAKFIITTAALTEKIAGVDLPVVIFGDDEVVPSFGSRATHRYSELLRTDTNGVPRIQISQDDIAALLYSSGTTGLSKGVVVTHRNFISCSCLYNSGVDEVFSSDHVLLVLLPMFHVYGLAICTMCSLARGIKVVVMPQFNFVEMLSFIQTYKITHLPLVPPIIIALAKQDVVLKFDLSSLFQIGSGAAPLGKDILSLCAKRFPNVKLKQGYGLTESTGACSTAPTNVSDMDAHYGASGILLPNTQGMIIDPVTNKPMPPTKQGEFWIRGPSIVKEYFKNPKATSETIDKDGWLHTGDLVMIDNDGYIHVLDRLKELIKYNAYQVAPAELEALLLSHPSILDCAVIPYPDEVAGQIPMAYIVQKPGSPVQESKESCLHKCHT
uniref:4-coumarate--CoA ligase n=1 Tax=Physcomitrium patens TaxID=3218 RepID=A0A7I4CUJ2_PHYPA